MSHLIHFGRVALSFWRPFLELFVFCIFDPLRPLVYRLCEPWSVVVSVLAIHKYVFLFDDLSH